MYAVVATVETFLFVFLCTKSSKTFICFSNIFVLCLFLFTFGQVILEGFFENEAINLTIVLRLFSEQDVLNSLLVLHLSFCAICEGILFAQSFVHIKNNNSMCSYQLDLELALMKRRAFDMIIVSFPIKFIIDFALLYVSLTQGFIARRMLLSQIPDFLITFGNFIYIGIALLIICYKYEPHKQKIVFVTSILYICILMIGGRRSENVSFLVIIIFTFLANRSFDFTVGKLFKSVFLMYASFAFLNFIVTLRAMNVRSLDIIFDTFIKRMANNNMFFEALREYGNTAYTAICVLVNWLPYYNPSYGKSYIYGLSAIMPNIISVFGELTRESNFAFTMQDLNIVTAFYTNIGGSLLGEFFFNFGLFGGIIASLVFGLFVGYCSRKLSYAFSNSFNYNIVYYFPIIFALLYWIRNYFGGEIREMVWGVFFCWLFSKITLVKNKSFTTHI